MQGRGKLETGIDIYILLKYTTNKDLLDSMGNSPQYCVMDHMEAEPKTEWMYVYT